MLALAEDYTPIVTAALDERLDVGLVRRSQVPTQNSVSAATARPERQSVAEIPKAAVNRVLLQRRARDVVSGGVFVAKVDVLYRAIETEGASDLQRETLCQ